MVFTKSVRVVSLIAGASVLLSGLTAAVTTNVINQENSVAIGSQGPAGSNGLPGSQGPAGPTGPAGQDGREVEFDTENNKLVWRYVGETEWNVVDLDLGGAGGFISSGGGVNEFSHWIFADERFDITVDLEEVLPLAASARVSYAQGLRDRSTDPYTAVSTLADLVAIGTNETTLKGRYVLMNDINLATRDLVSLPNNVINGSFEGIFDGAGYRLFNFDVPSSSVSHAGIFTNFNNATIRNLTLENTTFTVNSFSNTVGGALVGRINQAAEVTLESVVVKDFTTTVLQTNTQRIGGIAGYVDYGALINLNGVTVDNMKVITDFPTTLVGGLFGHNNWNTAIQGINVKSELIFEKVDPTNTRLITYVGGLVGQMDSDASLNLSQSDFSLTGLFQEEVGGIAGGISRTSVIAINAVTSHVDIENEIDNYSYAKGGLFGRLNQGSLVFISDVVTSGKIMGGSELGGLIGIVDERTILRIDDSTNNVDLIGEDEIGGFIGLVDEDPEIRLLINNSINNGDVSVSNRVWSGNRGVENVGGFIGLISNSDTTNALRWNQFWIRDSISNMNLIPLANEEGEIRSVDFENIGGAIGLVYEENFIRISNSTFNTTLEMTYQSGNYSTYDYFTVENVGGVVGLVSYEDDSDASSIFQLLGNTVSLDVSFVMSQLTPHLTNLIPTLFTQMSFYFVGIGGAFGGGYIDNMFIVDVAGTYDLDVSFSVLNNNFSNKNVQINFESIGGYLGYTGDQATLFSDSLSVNFDFDYNVSNNILSLDTQLIPQPYPSDFFSRIIAVGGFAGYYQGIGFMTNYEGAFDIDILDQSPVTGMVISEQTVYQVGSFTGNKRGIFLFN
jgi:hypothetical protein